MTRMGGAGLRRWVPCAALALGMLAAAAPAYPRDDAAGEGRQLGRSLRQGAANFASDAWHVVSSPARINRRSALWLAGVLATGAVIYANDQEILDAFERSRGNGLYDAVIDVGEFLEPVGNMGNTNVFYFGGLVLGYAFRIAPLQNVTTQILESHFIAGGIRNVGEITLGRSRPFEGDGPRHFEFNGGTSLPSGHASVMFELATILSHHVDRVPFTVLAYGLATSVALQRVDARTHWPSDVFAGVVIGTAVSRTLLRLHESRALALEPVLDARGGGLGMRLGARF